MSRLRDWYRKIDARLNAPITRSVLAGLVLLSCIAVFGWLLVTAHDLEERRGAIMTALADQNVNDGDEHAVSLRRTGTVTVNGSTYGGERFAQIAELLFDDGGNIAMSPAFADALLRDRYPDRIPRWVIEQPASLWLLAIAVTTWLLLIVGMGLLLPFLLVGAATVTLVGVSYSAGNEEVAWACAGIGLLTFTFLLLTRAALLVFHRPEQVFAVAHTVIKEASRTRIPLVFIVLILVLLPLLPLGLDPDSPLRFRLQTFMSRGLSFTFYLAACMTIFLSCATVAFEIRDRQIWQVMTKPVSRLRYLLGKWLGVVTLNLIIMLIASVSIFLFIGYLRDRPVAPGAPGYEDAQLVRDTVLTARVGGRPEFQMLTPEQRRERVDDIIRRDPDLAGLEDVPLVKLRALDAQIRAEFEIGQRSIPPFGGVREYIFTGLDGARRTGENLTLRYRFHIMRDDEHETFPAVFVLNNNANNAIERTFVPTMSHTLSIPPEFIQEDGTLSVSVVNLYEPPPTNRGAGALNFEADDFELLYRAGSFEMNFLRAILLTWVKLAFLAMLGICCATFLSFPVACLMSFTIFAAGSLGPFLAMSLEQYYPPSFDSVDWSNLGMVIQWAFRSFIRFIAESIVFLLEGFGALRPTGALVEGRLIPWSQVVDGLFRVGLLWSVFALGLGWIVMRRRQLAIYSGHG